MTVGVSDALAKGSAVRVEVGIAVAAAATLSVVCGCVGMTVDVCLRISSTSPTVDSPAEAPEPMFLDTEGAVVEGAQPVSIRITTVQIDPATAKTLCLLIIAPDFCSLAVEFR